MLSAVVDGIRFVVLYAPNGRVVGSPFYEGKLRWFERVRRWLDETRSPDEPLVLAGDYNVTPADEDVWDPVKAHGGTHVSEPERDALARAPGMGTHRRLSAPGAARQPLQLVGLPGRHVPSQRGHAHRPAVCDRSRSPKRVVWAEIDREARKGPPVPSDHAPVVIDLDAQGQAVRRRLGRGAGPDRRPHRPGARKSPAQIRYEEERRRG